MPSRSRHATRRRATASGLRVEVIAGTPGTSRVRGLARWLKRAAPPGAAGDVAVFLTTDARIRALNRRYRRTDRVTDVLSFPAESSLEPGFRRPRVRLKADPTAMGPPVGAGLSRPVGDIVIALGRARSQACDAGHSLDTELRVLALHGLLHLLGFDHETDDGRMARLEQRLRRTAGLREGLVERARGAGGARIAVGALRIGGAGGVR